jgi:hypothetical protein
MNSSLFVSANNVSHNLIVSAKLNSRDSNVVNHLRPKKEGGISKKELVTAVYHLKAAITEADENTAWV